MVDLSLDHRKRWGERITDDSPLFRAEYNPHNPSKSKVAPVPITRNAITEFIDVLLIHTGLRTHSLEGQQYQRLPIVMTHGFRKFFETNAFRAGMDNMYIRRLMGQKSGLEDSYLKLSSEELLEVDSKHVGYIGIIDQLTIDESNKLRREVQTLKVEKSNWETMPEEYQKANVRMDQVLKKAWYIANTTADERVRLQALSLIDQCNSHRMDLITNGTVVSDALKYVNGKAQKLDESSRKVGTFEEEEEEDYETTMTSEIEETTTNCSSSDS